MNYNKNFASTTVVHPCAHGHNSVKMEFQNIFWGVLKKGGRCHFNAYAKLGGGGAWSFFCGLFASYLDMSFVES